MPQGPSNGYAWRGHRADLEMIDAVADYEHLIRHGVGRIYQGGYSFATQSAGTHSRGGALDTQQLSNHEISVASSMGFYPSNRYTFQGFMPHCHWVLFGDSRAAPALRYQESELRAGRDGLAGRGADRWRRFRPRHPLTYRQWKNRHRPTPHPGPGPKPKPKPPGPETPIQKLLRRTPPKIVSVGAVNRARRGYLSGHTYYVQTWLRKIGRYHAPIDGKWGPVTQAALDGFRRSLGWPQHDCVGAIGITSLTRLRAAAHDTHPISK